LIFFVVKSGMMSYAADGSAKQIAFTQTAPTDLVSNPITVSNRITMNMRSFVG
jgi:hypothetical protein